MPGGSRKEEMAGFQAKLFKDPADAKGISAQSCRNSVCEEKRESLPAAVSACILNYIIPSGVLLADLLKCRHHVWSAGVQGLYSSRAAQVSSSSSRG